jgi:hypothetical protein
MCTGMRVLHDPVQKRRMLLWILGIRQIGGTDLEWPSIHIASHSFLFWLQGERATRAPNSLLIF